MLKLGFQFILTFVIGVSPVFAESPVKKDDFAEKIRAFGKNGEINEKRSAVAEVLVTRNEKKALDQINMLIRKYKGTSMEPGLQFRKAELIVRQAKSARFFEFTNTKGELLSMVPEEVKGSSIKKLKDAIHIFDDIERRFPKYEEMDLVLFNNAFLRQQTGEKQAPKDLYYSLIKRFPGSELIPDAYLSVAEMNYEQKLWKKALEDYESVKKFPDARVYPYALYKGAWTRYQLKDTRAAMTELEAVITVSDQRAAQNVESKYNLKEEALTDLVLFYSEKGEPNQAFPYFVKWAGKQIVGKLILQLAAIYERHGQNKEREYVLADFIDNIPENPQVPKAYRDLILNDINIKSDSKAFKHVVAFENHCHKYYKTELQDRITAGQSQKEDDLQDEEDSDMDAKPNCNFNLSKMSYKLSKKWHDEWKKKANKELAERVDKTYRIYIGSQIDVEKREKVRFSYAEFNFQRQYYKTAIEQYELVSQNIKDKTLLHDACYFAIVSLEKYVNGKWSDNDENKYIQLASVYLTKNPGGKFVTDVKFKKSFIAYEKARYAEALPGFRDLGWKFPKTELGLKSQDLYLDILNIQKDYPTLMSSTKELIQLTGDEKRKSELKNLYRESFFSQAQKFQADKKYRDALESYEKFAIENPTSKLADQAWWNIVQIHLVQKDYRKASDKCFELSKKFPGSKYTIEALKKAAELYEFLAQPELVGDVLTELAKFDSADAKKWKKLSVDFYVVGARYDKARSVMVGFLNSGESATFAEYMNRYEAVADKLAIDTKSAAKAMDAHMSTAQIARKQLDRVRKLFDSNDFAEAFGVAGRILSYSKKEVPNAIFAEARYIQSRILEKELVNQKMNSKVDRLQAVMGLKTEKLDKAQRAYQESMKFGDPDTTIKAFLGLARCYENFVSDLKGIRFTEKVAAADEKAIRSELEKMIIPLEDRIIDTLKEGIDFALTAKTFSGQTQHLRNELNRVNMKLNNAVAYKPAEPGISVVQ